jgi:hypothetical protein
MTASPTREFYRVVKTDPPSIEDFLSNAAKGDQPPDPTPETLRVWQGISVYATASQARRMARRYPRHGGYLALLRVHEGGLIRFERTLAKPGHHTLWGNPREFLACIVSVTPL